MLRTLEGYCVDCGLHAVRGVLAELSRAPRRMRVVAHNLERELALEHVPPDSFDKMLASLDSRLASAGGPTDLEQLVDELCRQQYSSLLSSTVSWREALRADGSPFFRAASGPDLTLRRNVYTSMPLLRFTTDCWQNTPLTTGRRSSPLAIDAAKAEARELLNSPTAFAEDLKNEGFKFSNWHHYFWLADFGDNLEGEVSRLAGDAGTWLRSQTGTAHHAGDFLIAFSLETRVLSNSEARQPTVMDAKGYAYFRRSWRGDGWGEALDLTSKKAGKPEAIHTERVLHDGVGAIPVGELGAPVEYEESDWEQVLAQSRGDFDAWRLTRTP